MGIYDGDSNKRFMDQQAEEARLVAKVEKSHQEKKRRIESEPLELRRQPDGSYAPEDV